MIRAAREMRPGWLALIVKLESTPLYTARLSSRSVGGSFTSSLPQEGCEVL